MLLTCPLCPLAAWLLYPAWITRKKKTNWGACHWQWLWHVQSCLYSIPWLATSDIWHYKSEGILHGQWSSEQVRCPVFEVSPHSTVTYLDSREKTWLFVFQREVCTPYKEHLVLNELPCTHTRTQRLRERRWCRLCLRPPTPWIFKPCCCHTPLGTPQALPWTLAIGPRTECWFTRVVPFLDLAVWEVTNYLMKIWTEQSTPSPTLLNGVLCWRKGKDAACCQRLGVRNNHGFFFVKPGEKLQASWQVANYQCQRAISTCVQKSLLAFFFFLAMEFWGIHWSYSVPW